MSALTDRIAAEHLRWFGGAGCKCGAELGEAECGESRDRFVAHIAEVTEAAVRAEILPHAATEWGVDISGSEIAQTFDEEAARDWVADDEWWIEGDNRQVVSRTAYYTPWRTS